MNEVLADGFYYVSSSLLPVIMADKRYNIFGLMAGNAFCGGLLKN